MKFLQGRYKIAGSGPRLIGLAINLFGSSGFGPSN